MDNSSSTCIDFTPDVVHTCIRGRNVASKPSPVGLLIDRFD